MEEGRPRRRPQGEASMLDSIWLALAVLFLIGWFIAFIAFHVAFAAIHILLGLFVLFLIIHFVRSAARRV
jgi:hypothetical protein